MPHWGFDTGQASGHHDSSDFALCRAEPPMQLLQVACGSVYISASNTGRTAAPSSAAAKRSGALCGGGQRLSWAAQSWSARTATDSSGARAGAPGWPTAPMPERPRGPEERAP